MSKKFVLKNYKIEVNDENKETKCTQIVICQISNPSKNKITWIFAKNIENILKLKRITKFNMILIINYFYLNIYRL